MRALRSLLGVALAAAILAVLVPRQLDDPERAFQRAVAGALASGADDRLLEVALDQYPEQTPAIAITYGHLDLFRQQLARFGPQVVPIVAAYQNAFTSADLAQIATEGLQLLQRWLTGGGRDRRAGEADAEQRGLHRAAQHARPGQRLRRPVGDHRAGEAKWVPSRLVTLGGAELLFGGLTGLERALVQGRDVDWRTYGLAAVDLAAIASGVTLLRFAPGSRAAPGPAGPRPPRPRAWPRQGRQPRRPRFDRARWPRPRCSGSTPSASASRSACSG